MVGENGSPNQVYKQSISLTVDPSGEKQEWLKRIEKYADNNDIEETEVMDTIIKEVIDESGEPDIKFKESIGL